MASIFTTGTINQPDAGSVGLTMAERIRDDVVAHAAWDLVEEFTAAAGTCRWYVFKCLAAQSGLPSDFYVVMCRTLGNGQLNFFICETYTAASHIAQHYCYGSYSTSFLMDGAGRQSTTFTLSTAPLIQNNTGFPNNVQWVPSGTSTKWWIIVSEDAFTVAFNGASNGFVHVGAFTPLSTLPNLMPLQINGNNNAGGYGCLTRNPAVADTTVNSACHFFTGGGGTYPSTDGNGLGFAAADLRYNDKLQGQQRAVAEVGMTIRQAQAGDSSAMGFALGKHKRMRMSTGQVPAGLAFGDAYVLAGRLWVPFKPDDGRMWDTGVASS